MFQTDQPTASNALPTPATAGTQGYFTNGNPSTGVAATILDADFMNMVMMELMNVVTAAGITPSKTTYNQVYLAIQALFSPGRALRTSVYTVVSGVQMVSVNGGTATSTGASTFTALSATTKIRVRGVGGGGGSGGTSATSSSQISIGSGGGGGGYGESIYTSGFSSPVAITVGAGGAAGSAGSAGVAGTGGTTSFGALLTVPGGNGGNGSSAIASTTSNSQIGALKGTAPTGANVIGVGGSPGGCSIFPTGSAPISGAGGSSIFGSGDNGHLGSVGGSGTGYGAGAGGAAAIASTAAQAGGTGTPGILIVEEFA